jgi:peptide/nickel transport system permease protein
MRPDAEIEAAMTTSSSDPLPGLSSDGQRGPALKGFARYMGIRLFGACVTLLILSFGMFVSLQRLVPGNEASVLAGSYAATPAKVHAIEVQLGLTRPIVVQYWSWLTGILAHGNFGTSAISGLKITNVIAQEAPVSLELALLGLLIATVIGVPIGMLAGASRNPRWDVALRLPFLVIYALPFFVIGAVLLLLSARYMHPLYSVVYVPLTASIGGNLRVMLLPSLTVGLPVAGLLMQMTRGAVADVMSQPHVITARAVGLKRRRLYGVYVLKAALLPIISLESFLYGILIGGVVVVEQVFSLPGLGRGLLNSIDNRDFLQLEAQVAVLAAAFIAGGILGDLVTPLVDRRVTRG